MVRVGDYFTLEFEQRVSNRIEANKAEMEERRRQGDRNWFSDRPMIQCEHIKPPGMELLGSGRNRCVFQAEDGVVAKVARTEDGIKENEGARTVINHVSDKHMDKFATPYDVNEDGTVMVAEQVRSVDGNTPPPGGEHLFEQVQDNMHKVEQEDGVACDDIAWNDIGFKNREPVLADLGGCTLDDR